MECRDDPENETVCKNEGDKGISVTCTGKYLSEALILALTNPQYDDRLFIALRVQYMNIPNPEHVVYINYSDCQNKKTNNSCTRT